MKKRTLVMVVSTVVILLLVVLLAFGYRKNDDKPLLNGDYALSPDERYVAFSLVKAGSSSLILHDMKAGENVSLKTGSPNEVLQSPSFSHDGKRVLIVGITEEEEKITSTLYVIDTESKKQDRILLENGVITEAIFSKDSDKVFYLKADVYTNYSPVASKAPHDFDIYMLNSKTRNIERLTNMQAYKISSLTIHENQLYFIKPKDAKTREEIFESRYHIYTLFINQPKEISKVAFERKEKDIYSFTISPNGKKILFTAIANRGNGKLFEYELYD